MYQRIDQINGYLYPALSPADEQSARCVNDSSSRLLAVVIDDFSLHS